ncbi:MAG: zinc ribbon domain-containing protein [Candidatus Sulfotelmatobacter sp.]
MAFCNSCGASLSPDARFCSRCGATIAAPGASPSLPVAPTSAPARGGNSAVKTVLIIVGVIVLLGGLGIASLTFVALHFARNSHVAQEGDHVKVETPFGSVETSKDPDKAVQDLGVDVYPGAKVQKDGASTATFGGMRTVTAAFQSSDSVDKVCGFYRAKFPGSRVATSSEHHCTIVSNDPHNIVTVTVESSGEGSKFQITSVITKDTSSNP